MDAKLSSKFPHSFDWVEIRTVWREVIKAKVRLMFLTPRAVKFGVMVFGIVCNDDYAASAITPERENPAAMLAALLF